MGEKMKLALILLTCNREDMTRRTLESLQKHVDLSRFDLIHGDDCSDSQENVDMARALGFKSLFVTPKRSGVSFMWKNLIRIAADRGAEWIITQENDWEWVRDFPFSIIDTAQAMGDVYSVRFFGKYKEANNTRPCGILHAAKKTSPDWRPIDTNWEKGDIHWGFPSGAIRARDAVFLTEAIESEGGAIKRSAQINDKVLRPYRNYVFHIGAERTKGFSA